VRVAVVDGAVALAGEEGGTGTDGQETEPTSKLGASLPTCGRRVSAGETNRVFGWGASRSRAAPLPFSACLVGSKQERNGSTAEYSCEIQNESARPK
jgi:hypothetical protein